MLLIVLTLAGAVAVLSTLLVRERSRVLRQRRHTPMIVTLKSGEGFKGVLHTDDRQALVLRNVEAIDSKPVPVDGEVIVPWSDVKYLQRL